MELKDALEKGISALEGHSLDPRRETQNILIQLADISLLDFVIGLDKELDESISKEFEEILSKRVNDQPLAYILNKVDFFGHTFFIDENVLIPRPDTERSVEILLSQIEDNSQILEIGIGSGCVSLSCAYEKQNSLFHGVDISSAVLHIAEYNKKRFGLKNIMFWKSDLFSDVVDKYDIIYSNPPYISTEEIVNLQNSVKNYEPLLALDGGADGLEFYRIISKAGRDYLKSGGKIVFEIGYDQDQAVKEILKTNNYIDVEIRNDYGNKPRVIWARKRD